MDDNLQAAQKNTTVQTFRISKTLKVWGTGRYIFPDNLLGKIVIHPSKLINYESMLSSAGGFRPRRLKYGGCGALFPGVDDLEYTVLPLPYLTRMI